jgi:uncharacterized membrane protein YphA (DoxX/SURF4 family)
MRSNIFGIRNQPVSLDLVLLITRIVVGYAFVLHGWENSESLHWMGSESACPGVFQALAAISEFSGFALILGLLTRLGALGSAVPWLLPSLCIALSWVIRL